MEKEQEMYEIGYLLNPLLPEEKLDEEIFVLRNFIESGQAGRHGFIISEERAKMHKLAYPIKKNGSAYFGWIKFVAEPEALAGIKNNFDKNGNVIRFLIIKGEQETESQSVSKKRKIIKRAPMAIDGGEKEIKTEEIDKKLEELLAVSQ